MMITIIMIMMIDTPILDNYIMMMMMMIMMMMIDTLVLNADNAIYAIYAIHRMPIVQTMPFMRYTQCHLCDTHNANRAYNAICATRHNVI